MTHDATPELEDLLGHAIWTHQLAARLVRDTDDADEVVQSVRFALLGHPIASIRAPRAFLGTLVRRFARDLRKSDTLRSAREAAVSKPEATNALSEQQNRAALQQELTDVVLQLDERLRSTIWEIYYNERSLAEIAAREGVSVSAIKTRHARALESLRESLDRKHGGRREAWIAALLPLARRSRAPVAAATTARFYSNLKVAGVLVALSLSIAWIAFRERSPAPLAASDANGIPTTLAETTKTRQRSDLEAQPSTRNTRRAAIVQGIEDLSTSSATLTVRGRVLDLQERPVADVEVVSGSSAANTSPALTRSRMDGTFDVSLNERASAVLACRSERWQTVSAAYVYSARDAREATIIVALRRPVRGVVLDPSRRPIEDCDVRYELRDLDRAYDAGIPQQWSARTDGLGHFEIPEAPIAAGALNVIAQGYATEHVPVNEPDVRDLEIVLREEAHVRAVAGRVVDERGRPVDGALMTLSWSNGFIPSTTTKSDGRFAFRVACDGNAVSQPTGSQDVASTTIDMPVLVAAKSHRRPVRHELPSLLAPIGNATEEEIVLVMHDDPLTIRGRIVDLEGKAISGAAVTTCDETFLGASGYFLRLQGCIELDDWGTAELIARGGCEAPRTLSGPDGSFAISGLLEGDYRIAAIDVTTLRHSVTEPIRAGGSDVVIVMPGTERCVRVAGRLLLPDGSALAGVDVRIGTTLNENGYWYSMAWERSIGIQRVTTNEKGEFQFDRIDPEGLYIEVMSQSVYGCGDVELANNLYEPRKSDKLDHLEIAVSRRCYVQLQLEDRYAAGASVRILDRNGREMAIPAFARGIMDAYWVSESIAGSSNKRLTVGETARTLVVFDDSGEIERIPFTPSPGATTVIR